MSLFSLFISWSPPLTPPLSFTLFCFLSVCISLTLSVYYALCHRAPSFCFSFCLSFTLALCFSLCCCTLGLWSQIIHISLMEGDFLLFFIVSITLAPPLPFSTIPFLLFLSFHTAETMRFNCPDATSCKLSETLRRTLSHSWIQHWKQFGWSYWGQVGV